MAAAPAVAASKILWQRVEGKNNRVSQDAIHALSSDLANPQIKIKNMEVVGAPTYTISLSNLEFDSVTPWFYRVVKTTKQRQRLYMIIFDVWPDSARRNSTVRAGTSVTGFLRFRGDVINWDTGEVNVHMSTNFIDPRDAKDAKAAANRHLWDFYIQNRGTFLEEKTRSKQCKRTLTDVEQQEANDPKLHKHELHQAVTQALSGILGEARAGQVAAAAVGRGGGGAAAAGAAGGGAAAEDEEFVIPQVRWRSTDNPGEMLFGETQAPPTQFLALRNLYTVLG